MASQCDLCYQDTRNRKRDHRGHLLCTECRDYAAYWGSLTPAERRDEEASMAHYAANGADE